MSHYFDKGANELYFLAPWAAMSDRASQYRAARSERVRAADTRPELGAGRFGKPASGSRAEVYEGFVGVNEKAATVPSSRTMFKTKAGQTVAAIGMVETLIMDGNGDAVGGGCVAGTSCGSGCGSSSCGGPACAAITGGYNLGAISGAGSKGGGTCAATGACGSNGCGGKHGGCGGFLGGACGGGAGGGAH